MPISPDAPRNMPITNPASLANSTHECKNETELGLSFMKAQNVSSTMHKFLFGCAVAGGTAVAFAGAGLTSAHFMGDLYHVDNDSQSGSERVFNEKTLQEIAATTLGVASFMVGWVVSYFSRRAEDVPAFSDRMSKLSEETQEKLKETIKRGNEEEIKKEFKKYGLITPFLEVSRA